MKKIFANTGELVHIWAYKRQPEGSTRTVNRLDGSRGRQAFFEGDTYYSCGKHYVIAKHLPNGSVAINIEKNSPTTNGHVHEAYLAVRHLPNFRVYNPGGRPDRQRTDTHIQNLLDTASRAKPDGNRPRLLAEAQKVADDYHEFCQALGVQDQPGYERIHVASNPQDLLELRKAHLAYAAEEKKRRAARAAQRAIDDADKIAAWRAGVGHSLDHSYGTLLRLNPHNPYVDTSLGAHIPVEDAKRLWPLILKVKAAGFDEPFERPLGHYQLTEIRKDGSIVVGCPDIAFAEIEGIAHELGLTKTSEASRAWDKTVGAANA